ncbi:MAG: restriction endonuclease subunit [Bryobacterales bacterium]|nr:restriction endonuclease subunit [Bryobacterales bacterium]
MPISWHGTLQQYVGRLHRLHDGKKIVEVYDYVDSSKPMLARMFEKRLKGYKPLGTRSMSRNRGPRQVSRGLATPMTCLETTD